MMIPLQKVPRIEDNSPELVLQNWFSDCPGVIELRLLPSKSQYYHDTPDSLIKASGKCNGEAVYFGVATRDGKGGGKANIVAIPGVWVDLDFKETQETKLKNSCGSFR